MDGMVALENIADVHSGGDEGARQTLMVQRKLTSVERGNWSQMNFVCHQEVVDGLIVPGSSRHTWEMVQAFGDHGSWNCKVTA